MALFITFNRSAGLIMSILMTSSFAHADTVDSIHLLKISSQDERAVVKMEDGTKKIIKIGDAIGKNGKVIEITSGRVVIEEQMDGGSEIVIIRLEEGKQWTEHISRLPDSKTLLYKAE
ncbi:MAG: hypothetical protein HZB62_07685 [Nitrospirae bacterium]|nr:hypothetical protein [Nitrospirota bacterium]